MVGLVESVSEIVEVTNYRGRSPASDEVCSENTGDNAKKKCRNRREKYWF